MDGGLQLVKIHWPSMHCGTGQPLLDTNCGDCSSHDAPGTGDSLVSDVRSGGAVASPPQPLPKTAVPATEITKGALK
jgi:hypothetical protein